VRETRLAADMFMLPLFVCDGEGVRRGVGSGQAAVLSQGKVHNVRFYP